MKLISSLLILLSTLSLSAANPCLEEYGRCNDQNWADRKKAKAACEQRDSYKARQACMAPLKDRWERNDDACKARRDQCLGPDGLSSEDIDKLSDDIGLTDYQRQKEYEDYLESIKRAYCQDTFRICIAEARQTMSPFTQQDANNCHALENICLGPDLASQLFSSDTGTPNASYILLMKKKLNDYIKKSSQQNQAPAYIDKAIYAATGVRG